MRKRKSVKLFITLIALILGLSVGVLIIPLIINFFRPTTTSSPQVIAPESNTEQSGTSSAIFLGEVESWKAYTSDEYGISFKYPQTFQMNVFNEENQAIDMFGGITFGRVRMPEKTLYQPDFEQLGYVISVEVDHARSLSEVSKSIEENTNLVKTATKVAGIESFKYEGNTQDATKLIYLFERQKKVYLITLTKYAIKPEVITEADNVFKKMVSTIQF